MFFPWIDEGWRNNFSIYVESKFGGKILFEANISRIILNLLFSMLTVGFI
jgi:hypothetical protein